MKHKQEGKVVISPIGYLLIILSASVIGIVTISAIFNVGALESIGIMVLIIIVVLFIIGASH